MSQRGCFLIALTILTIFVLLVVFVDFRITTFEDGSFSLSGCNPFNICYGK